MGVVPSLFLDCSLILYKCPGKEDHMSDGAELFLGNAAEACFSLAPSLEGFLFFF